MAKPRVRLGRGLRVAKPDAVLWDYAPHTEAKHRILKRYLQAWVPIMASQSRVLNIIDGFAGPGRYEGGDPGSPLIMLDAYLGHRDRQAMGPVKINYDFIEIDARRVVHLEGELAAIAIPGNVSVTVTRGAFDEVMDHWLSSVPKGRQLAPTFAFIDPFGYTGHTLNLSSRILEFPRCEVLVYVPLPFIARFIHDPAVEPALNNLFGDDSWKAASEHRGKAAERVLHDIFLAKLEAAAGLARSFQIAAGDRGWSGSTLFFGTGNLVGLRKFKEAMWAVDPLGGLRFADSTNPHQMVVFDEPDFRELEAALHSRFGTDEFSVEDAENFVDLRTAFVATKHLRTKTLRPAEVAGRLTAFHPHKSLRRGTYPAGTLLRFT